METYAVVNEDVIVNVIVAESKSQAESTTGLAAIKCVDGKPGIGWIRDEVGWKSGDVGPYPSWIWNYDLLVYEPPIPCPDDLNEHYKWDESVANWVIIKPPVESTE